MIDAKPENLKIFIIGSLGVAHENIDADVPTPRPTPQPAASCRQSRAQSS
jgi:hypothetical protein